jgi:hypothetical protein
MIAIRTIQVLKLPQGWNVAIHCGSFHHTREMVRMRTTLVGIAVGCLLLSGCHKSLESVGPRSQGRFAGIGVFDAGKLWAQMAVSGSTDTAPAKIADDEHIIVVLDSHTGEVRQCGDHSGYCVAMNPWAGPQAMAPVKLTKHASDLAAEYQAGTDKLKAAK